MSYGPVLSRMETIVRGQATEGYIKETFKAYKHPWKNECLQEVARKLSKVFGGKGNWYPEPRRPKYVLGFWFKPSIKGIWYHEGRAYAVLINARKGQPLSGEDVRFLARGIYELHCLEDPNDPIPLIVDLSEHDLGKGREVKVHIVPHGNAASLDEFEQALREFLIALNLAGIALPVSPSAGSIINLFKKH